MVQLWLCGGLLALALTGTATGAGAPASDGMGLVLVTQARGVAHYDLGYRDGYNNLPQRYQDRDNRDYAEGYRVGQARRQAAAAEPSSDGYERGYTVGLNGKDARERDSEYRAGYRAGRAKHEANKARADGRDYARGYRDGYNRYRERAAVPSENRAYAAGFRAGQADHTALVVGSPERPEVIAALPPPTPDNLVGRPAATLDRDMKSLGFVQQAHIKKGRESFSTWRSHTHNRCLRIVTRDGKVQQTTDVDNTNCT